MLQLLEEDFPLQYARECIFQIFVVADGRIKRKEAMTGRKSNLFPHNKELACLTCFTPLSTCV